MQTYTKKFVISFPRRHARTFFDIARKHISKRKGTVRTRVSRDIDKILYGA